MNRHKCLYCSELVGVQKKGCLVCCSENIPASVQLAVYEDPSCCDDCAKSQREGSISSLSHISESVEGEQVLASSSIRSLTKVAAPDGVEEGFDRVEAGFDRVEEGFDRVEEGFDGVEEGFDGVDGVEPFPLSKGEVTKARVLGTSWSGMSTSANSDLWSGMSTPANPDRWGASTLERGFSDLSNAEDFHPSYSEWTELSQTGVGEEAQIAPAHQAFGRIPQPDQFWDSPGLIREGIPPFIPQPDEIVTTWEPSNSSDFPQIVALGRELLGQFLGQQIASYISSPTKSRRIAKPRNLLGAGLAYAKKDGLDWKAGDVILGFKTDVITVYRPVLRQVGGLSIPAVQPRPFDISGLQGTLTSLAFDPFGRLYCSTLPNRKIWLLVSDGNGLTFTATAIAEIPSNILWGGHFAFDPYNEMFLSSGSHRKKGQIYKTSLRVSKSSPVPLLTPLQVQSVFTSQSSPIYGFAFPRRFQVLYSARITTLLLESFTTLFLESFPYHQKYGASPKSVSKQFKLEGLVKDLALRDLDFVPSSTSQIPTFEKVFTVQDFLQQDWENELVSFPIEPPPQSCQVGFLSLWDPDDSEIPFQLSDIEYFQPATQQRKSIKRAIVWFIVKKLKNSEKLEYVLRCNTSPTKFTPKDLTFTESQDGKLTK